MSNKEGQWSWRDLKNEVHSMTAPACCLHSFSTVVQRGELQVESGAFPKLRSRTGGPERFKWLKFTGQNTGKERATLRKKSGDLQRSTVFSSCTWGNYSRLEKEPFKRIKKNNNWKSQNARKTSCSYLPVKNLLIHGASHRIFSTGKDVQKSIQRSTQNHIPRYNPPYVLWKIWSFCTYFAIWEIIQYFHLCLATD